MLQAPAAVPSDSAERPVPQVKSAKDPNGNGESTGNEESDYDQQSSYQNISNASNPSAIRKLTVRYKRGDGRTSNILHTAAMSVLFYILIWMSYFKISN